MTRPSNLDISFVHHDPLSPFHSIEWVGGYLGNIIWFSRPRELAALMLSHQLRCWVSYPPPRVEVVPVPSFGGSWHIATQPDSIQANNLDRLGDFPLPVYLYPLYGAVHIAAGVENSATPNGLLNLGLTPGY